MGGENFQNEIVENKDCFVFFPNNLSIKIDGQYTSFDLFTLSAGIIYSDINSCHLNVEELLKHIRPCSSDVEFGDIYAIIGRFFIEGKVGYVIIVSQRVAKNLFDSLSICQCVQFDNNTVNSKLRKRIGRANGIKFVDHSCVSLNDMTVTSMTLGEPFLINPRQKTKPYLDNQLPSIWNGIIDDGVKSVLMADRIFTNSVKKRVLIKVQPQSSKKRDSSSKKASLESFLTRGYSMSVSKDDLNSFSSISEKINLREETISFGESMFSIDWSPEKFTDAFCQMERICGSNVLSSLATSILMDPSYRLSDCDEVDISDIIGVTSVDLDQLIIKFNLFTNNQQFVSDDQRLVHWYAILEPLFSLTKDATTIFCPTTMKIQSNRGGTSIDSTTECKRHVALPTKGITSEVLNISYKRTSSEIATVDECIEASLIVMTFLFSSKNSIFRNENNLEMLNAAKINWNHIGKQSLESFQMSGGLLFQFLTLFLLSSRGQYPIRVSIETYGGKKRGEKVEWEFPQEYGIIPSTENIRTVFEKFCLSEERKIAFLLKRSIKEIIKLFPGMVYQISTHLGLGCDARGKKLRNGNPSYLVCQPTIIKEIELSRKGTTNTAFARGSKGHRSGSHPDLSKKTRLIARKCDSRSDSDSSLEEENAIRTRWE